MGELDILKKFHTVPDSPERWTADFTGELLNVLWILEATIALYPAQRELLNRIVEGFQNER